MTRDQRGAVVVRSAALAGLLVAVAVLAGVVAGAVVAQRRAASAADLAALAGATAVQHGLDGCVAASRSVTVNLATLTACEVEGEVVTVTVVVAGPVVASLSAVAEAAA